MDTALPLFKERVKEIKKLAKKYNWEFAEYQKNIGMISFIKMINDSKARLNIYVTKMTVATCITHPKKGKTQLFRRNVDMRLMANIFDNPRQHTGKGYYTTL